MPSKNKLAQRAYQHTYFENNREYYKNRRTERRKRHMDRFIELKSRLSCVICNENDEATFDFHHFDPAEKDNLVYTILRSGASWTRIMMEIAKCVCLCANCHRKVHKHEEWSQRISVEDKIKIPADLLERWLSGL